MIVKSEWQDHWLGRPISIVRSFVVRVVHGVRRLVQANTIQAKNVVNGDIGPYSVDGIYGEVDSVSAEAVEGWALNAGFPDLPLAVCLSVGRTELATVSASGERDDVSEKFGRTVLCGFRFVWRSMKIPDRILRDPAGRKIVLRVSVARSGDTLGQPIVVSVADLRNWAGRDRGLSPVHGGGEGSKTAFRELSSSAPSYQVVTGRSEERSGRHATRLASAIQELQKARDESAGLRTQLDSAIEQMASLRASLEASRVQQVRENLIRDLAGGLGKGTSPNLVWRRVLLQGLAPFASGASSAAELLARSAIVASGIFDPDYYLRNLATFGVQANDEPILHFLRIGGFVGLSPGLLFDTEYYVRQCGANELYGVNPLVHYLDIGWRRHLDPHPLFDTSHYLQANPDVAESGVNPLVHFLKDGARELRDPSPLFHVRRYCETYPEVASSGENPLAHFIRHGANAGYLPNPLFDPRYYREQLPVDDSVSVLNPLVHYIAFGAARGLKPHPYFDGEYYLRTYPDVAREGMNPLTHFLTNGWQEGRRPNLLFDPAFYVEVHEDLRTSGCDPLGHYLDFGRWERRRPHRDFDPKYYLATYTDLDEKTDPLTHFLDHGGKELRWPNPNFDPVVYLIEHPDAAVDAAHPLAHNIEHGPVSTFRHASTGIDRWADLPWLTTGNPTADPQHSYKVLLIAHNASRTGAPICMLRLLEQLVLCPDLDCHVVLHEDGPLRSAFSALAPTLVATDVLANKPASERVALMAKLFREVSNRCVAVVNTATLSDYAVAFDQARVPVLSWVHELPTTIDGFLDGATTMRRLAGAAQRILCPSEFVRQALISHYNLDDFQVLAIRNGTELPDASSDRAEIRGDVRRQLGLPADARIVLGCGTVDSRKGADLFVQLAQRVVVEGNDKSTWFVWVGDAWDSRFARWLQHDVERFGIAGRVMFLGSQENPGRFFAAADVFALTSREDPFPMVNMEALAHGLPVIAFQGGGGAVEVLTADRGIVVPYLDVDAMAIALRQLLGNPRKRHAMGAAGAAFTRESGSWPLYADKFLSLLSESFHYQPYRPHTVSVIVPNYNYEPYLEQRLNSILGQTRKPDEIIFLDDSSTDGSVALARRILEPSGIPFRVIVNDANSGCTFRQWVLGLSFASTDLVWIAEADDWCESTLLEHLLPEFNDPSVQLAYCQSAIVGSLGQVYAQNYRGYTDEIDQHHWLHWYSVPAEEEVSLALSQKNTIPNASAVVFRRPIARGYEDRLGHYRLCGDWYWYVDRIRDGKISFVPQVLNYHRRHPKTVSNSIEKTDSAIGEALAVKQHVFKHYPLTTNRKCRSVAWAVFEHDRLTRSHGASAQQMVANTAYASQLKDLYESIHPQGYSDRLRILSILPDMQVGGGQTAAIRLANAFGNRHDSFMINARPALCEDDMVDLVSNRVCLLEGTLGTTEWAAPDGAHGISERPERIGLLRQLIAFHRIDVVLSHVWWADRLAYALVKDLDVPWIIRMHGCYEGLMDSPEVDPEFHDLACGMLRSTAGIIYSTERNLQVLDGCNVDPRPPVCRLFNGYDQADLPALPVAAISRDKNDFVFCLCSRAIPEKGWEEAIQAIEAINSLPASERGGKRARLILVGGGAYADSLSARYAPLKEVDFKGQLSSVVDVVQHCDVGLLPSRFASESLPSTIVEYFACGIPAIATDIGSIPDMVKADGRAAALLLPLHGGFTFDSSDLADLMLRYMTDATLYAEHKANADYVFKKLFRMSSIADQYTAVLRSAVEHRRKFAPT